MVNIRVTQFGTSMRRDRDDSDAQQPDQEDVPKNFSAASSMTPTIRVARFGN